MRVCVAWKFLTYLLQMACIVWYWLKKSIIFTVRKMTSYAWRE